MLKNQFYISFKSYHCFPIEAVNAEEEIMQVFACHLKCLFFSSDFEMYFITPYFKVKHAPFHSNL